MVPCILDARLKMSLSFQRTASLMLLLAIAFPGCTDTGLALVALELEIVVVSADGVPMPNAEVLLEDHHLPRGNDPRKRHHYVCTTDRSGKCNGNVDYMYAVRRRPWQKVRTGPIPGGRFELLVQRGGQVESLGFLPQLRSDQLHGATPVSFSGAP